MSSRSPVLLVASLCVALVLSLLGFMAPAAVLGEISRDWALSNSEAGWLGGALFLGYIATVPVLTAYTDRVDPRRIYLASAIVGAVGNFGFGFVADGLWSGVAFRVLTGIGLAGTYTPGLKALADQLPDGSVQQRGVTYYTAVFGFGSGLSILSGGLFADWFGWHWAFAVAGCGAVGAALVVAVALPAAPPRIDPAAQGAVLDFRPVFRDRAVMGYIFSFLGIAWEVFTSRIWLVSFFVFLAERTGDGDIVLSAAAWATAVALVGPPAAMVFGELAVRFNRRVLLVCVAMASLALAVAIGLTAEMRYEIPLVLCILFGMVSYGRNSATSAGTIAAADPSRRGATLAVQAFIGFSGGVLGPLAFGIALDAAGGTGLGGAWTAALAVMALGPVLSILSLTVMRGKGPGAGR